MQPRFLTVHPRLVLLSLVTRPSALLGAALLGAALLGAALLALAGCRLEERPERHAPVPAGDAGPIRADEAAEGTGRAGQVYLAPSGLAIPVVGVRPEDLIDSFLDPRGEPDSLGVRRRHHAIDLLAPTGTPVVAVDDGTVARLFTSVPGGLTIYHLADDGQTVYYYAHLDAYAPGLAEGQRLRRGQVIGTVGATGNADPATPHLHFAIWRIAPGASFWDGEPVNPYPLLGGR
ncbi:MAG: M23 family metallopeptidase [Rubricoccaceae bacterium]